MINFKQGVISAIVAILILMTVGYFYQKDIIENNRVNTNYTTSQYPSKSFIFDEMREQKNKDRGPSASPHYRSPQKHSPFVWKTAIKVFRDIKQVTGVNNVNLVRSSDEQWMNASASFNPKRGKFEITFSTAMLNFLEGNPDWIAMIMAHEMSHITNGELSTFKRSTFCRMNNANNRQCEKEADLQGQIYAKRAGYDECVGPAVWAKMIKVKGPSPPNSTHPDSADRARYLKCR